MENIAYNPALWSTFFSAQVSASAALAGLIFVAISINLPKIVVQKPLVARSARALATLAGVLLASTLCLVPSHNRIVLGWELTVLGVALWAVTTITQHGAISQNPYVSPRARIFHYVLAEVSNLPFVLAGVSLAVGRWGGLYWLVVGIVFSFLSALIDGWVLLIEILR